MTLMKPICMGQNNFSDGWLSNAHIDLQISRYMNTYVWNEFSISWHLTFNFPYWRQGFIDEWNLVKMLYWLSWLVITWDGIWMMENVLLVCYACALNCNFKHKIVLGFEIHEHSFMCGTERRPKNRLLCPWYNYFCKERMDLMSSTKGISDC